MRVFGILTAVLLIGCSGNEDETTKYSTKTTVKTSIQGAKSATTDISAISNSVGDNDYLSTGTYIGTVDLGDIANIGRPLLDVKTIQISRNGDNLSVLVKTPTSEFVPAESINYKAPILSFEMASPIMNKQGIPKNYISELVVDQKKLIGVLKLKLIEFEDETHFQTFDAEFARQR